MKRCWSRAQIAFIALFGAGFVYYVVTHDDGPMARGDIGRKPASSGPAQIPEVGRPGEDLPKVGRSLFDALMTEDRGGGKREYSLPFPFEKLIARLGGTSDGSVRGVLIAQGRSLQRSAAGSQFFRFPRAVVFGDSPSLRGRIYIGYQEKANALEVISYNDQAGRFEFQVVRDYGPGKTPQVFQASRELCVSCHQGQGPIFSQPLWQETNANVANAQGISKALGGATAYQGLPISIGTGVPQDFQARVDEMAYLPAVQAIWSDGCSSSDCRAGVAMAALLARMGVDPDRSNLNRVRTYRERSLPELRSSWSRNWPGGIGIPDPDIPNRNPSEKRKGAAFPSDRVQASAVVQGVLGDLVKNSDIPAELEPLNPRGYREVWRVSSEDDGDLSRFISGVSRMLQSSDAQLVDSAIFDSARASADSSRRAVYVSSCRIQSQTAEKISLACGGGDSDEAEFNAILSLQKSEGSVGKISLRARGERCRPAVSTESNPDSSITPCMGTLSSRGPLRSGDAYLIDAPMNSGGFHLRRGDGAAIERIEIRLNSAGGAQAKLSVIRDVSLLEDALLSMAASRHPSLGQSPFQRMPLMKELLQRLRISSSRLAFVDAAADDQMPPARVEEVNHLTILQFLGSQADPGLQVLGHRCAQCHDNSAGFPPNFLSGDLNTILAKVDHCAERIAYRLAMWNQPIGARPIVPMPPLRTLENGEEAWKSSQELADLRAYIEGLLAKRKLSTQKVMARPFTSWPECRE